jgi:hypothetical protein
MNLKRDALTELSEDDEVKDDGCGEEGVLTRVVDDDSVASSQHQFTAILVQCSLAVTDEGYVFDDNTVIRLLTIGVEDLVSVNHVIHHRALCHLYIGHTYWIG